MVLNPILARGVTSILVICAVIITAILVRRELFWSETPAPVPILRLPDTTWQKVIDKDLIRGSRTARVKIVEFYDYACPFCRSIQPNLNEIRQKYPDDVVLIHRHFPFPSHPTAYPSAVAAECAHEQGNFEEYHAALFLRQELSATLSETGLAQMVGMPNLPRFRECLEQSVSSGKVDADIRMAKYLGIDVIRTLIVDGRIYTGLLSTSELEKVVQQVLQGGE